MIYAWLGAARLLFRRSRGAEASWAERLLGIALYLAFIILVWVVPGVYQGSLALVFHAAFGDFFQQYFWCAA